MSTFQSSSSSSLSCVFNFWKMVKRPRTSEQLYLSRFLALSSLFPNKSRGIEHASTSRRDICGSVSHHNVRVCVCKTGFSYSHCIRSPRRARAAGGMFEHGRAITLASLSRVSDNDDDDENPRNSIRKHTHTLSPFHRSTPSPICNSRKGSACAHDKTRT